MKLNLEHITTSKMPEDSITTAANAQRGILVPFSDWIALTIALDSSPDIAPRDLAKKAQRIMDSRKRCAKKLHDLERKS